MQDRNECIMIGASAMALDVMHMLEGIGIETGVHLDKLIECVWMCEEILGRHLWGHVSRTGPRPPSVKALYPTLSTPSREKVDKDGRPLVQTNAGG